MRRTRLAALLGAGLLFAMLQFLTASTAHADDCNSFGCGKLYNSSGHTAVAASFDRSGGSCPPLANPGQYPHCGTCDVRSGSNSTDSCGWLFKDTDAFTFDGTSFEHNGHTYNRHTYVRINNNGTVYCTRNALGWPKCYGG
ncbi:hypothetical protein [Planotetraspora sp. GP83]|uniref:hypothetical protein n=1 Tax=Planotetraspora sp. GP83 TaxID=3156264 RepID=UPI003511A75A